MGGCESKDTHFTHVRRGDDAARKAEGLHLTPAQQKHFLESAVEHYDRAVDANPNYHLSYMRRGQALHRLGHLEAALSDFGESQALNPLFYPAYFAKADCLDDAEEFDLAVMERSRIPRALRKDQAARERQGQCGASARSLPEGQGEEQREVRRRAFEVFQKEQQRRQKGVAASTTAAGPSSGNRQTDGVDDDTVPLPAVGAEDVELLTEEEARELRRFQDYAKAGIALRPDGEHAMSDVQKYAPIEKQWRAENRRAENVRRFIRGERGIYVHSAAQRRANLAQGERRAQFTRRATQHDISAAKAVGYSAL